MEMKCQICDKVLDTAAELSKISPYASIVTCIDHKQYQFMVQLSLAKALAGFNTDNLPEDYIESARKQVIESHQKKAQIINMVRETKADSAEEVIQYIIDNVRI